MNRDAPCTNSGTPLVGKWCPACGQPAWLAVAKTPLALAVLVGSSMIYRGLLFGIVFALS